MSKKEDLIGEVALEVRRTGALSVLISNAVARRFALNTSDLECLDLVVMKGEVTAGELAKASGLTTGAVTALIDRLETAGYVVRDADPGDRRRVVVRPVLTALRPLEAAYGPLHRVTTELWRTFTEAELRVVLDFLRRSGDVVVACAEEIGRPQPAGTRAKAPGKRR